MEDKNIEPSDKKDLKQQYEDAKFQMETLKKVLSNLYIVDKAGNKTLRSGVKEKDIQMISEAIIKIKSNFKDILTEMRLMEERFEDLDNRHSKTRDKFISFFKDTGVKIPKFFKDLYQIDG